MTEATSIAPARSAAFIFVFITVLLDMLALGIIIPVLPRLVVDFVGGDAARGADYLGLFGTAWALMQFVFSPVHGMLVRPLRPQARHPDLEFRAWPRLYPDGAGADAVVAVRRTHHFRHLRSQHFRCPTPTSPM